MLSHTVSQLRSIAVLGIALILTGCTGGSGAALTPSAIANQSGINDQSSAGPGSADQRSLLPVDKPGVEPLHINPL